MEWSIHVALLCCVAHTTLLNPHLPCHFLSRSLSRSLVRCIGQHVLYMYTHCTRLKHNFAQSFSLSHICIGSNFLGTASGTKTNYQNHAH